MPVKAQVTPENAEVLAEALRALGQHGRGLVRVTAHGIVGGGAPAGQLTCNVRQRDGVLSVDCHIGALAMPTPAMPLGSAPVHDGDVVAWFETGDGWVRIEYHQYLFGLGWRHFRAVAK